MKKIIAVMTAVFLLVTLIAGCKKNIDDAESSSVAETSSGIDEYDAYAQGYVEEPYAEETVSDDATTQDSEEESVDPASEESSDDSSDSTSVS